MRGLFASKWGRKVCTKCTLSPFKLSELDSSPRSGERSCTVPHSVQYKASFSRADDSALARGALVPLRSAECRCNCSRVTLK